MHNKVAKGFSLGKRERRFVLHENLTSGPSLYSIIVPQIRPSTNSKKAIEISKACSFYAFSVSTRIVTSYNQSGRCYMRVIGAQYRCYQISTAAPPPPLPHGAPSDIGDISQYRYTLLWLLFGFVFAKSFFHDFRSNVES